MGTDYLYSIPDCCNLRLFSSKFFLGLFIMLSMFGVYAAAWQQILKHTALNLAYLFKGTGLFFILLFMHLLFDEPITSNNVIGAVFICGGITLFAKA